MFFNKFSNLREIKFGLKIFWKGMYDDHEMVKSQGS
jgi:hypothetical protein